jgi:aryl-alcohol dehydrogenase (NADP+)
MTLFDRFGQRYLKPRVNEAVAAYAEVAQRHNLSLTALSLAFVRSRWFTTSTIIGATTLKQLEENIDSVKIELNQDILNDIDAVYTQYPNPAP